MYSRHIDKRPYSIMFRKCDNRSCSHCTQHPVELKDVMQSLPTRQQGALFNAPTPATDDSHYMTYLEKKAAGKDVQYKTTHGLRSQVECCTEPGCFWVFSSAADSERHMRLVHRQKGRKRAADSDTVAEGAFRVKKAKAYTVCRMCNKTFSGPHFLKKHRKETGHTNTKKNTTRKK